MRIPILLIFLAAIALPASAEPDHAGASADHHAEEGVLGPDMLANETWSYTFTEATTFEYHCHPHPWMQASITVVASNGSAAQNHTINVVEPEDFEQWTFDPIELTVMVGDTVTWVNGGAQMHKIGETTAAHADHIAGAGSTVDGSSHDASHEHGSGGGKAFLYIVGAAVIGIVIAGWVKRRGA